MKLIFSTKFTFLAIFLFPLVVFSQSKKELKVISKGVSQIEKRFNEFDSKIEWNSPLQRNFVFFRTKNKDGIITNFIKLSVYGTSLETDKKGLIVIFEDGERFEKPEVNVDYEANIYTGGWNYSAFVEVNKEELSLFAEKKVKAIRLYIFDSYLIEDEKLLTMGWAKGILDSN